MKYVCQNCGRNWKNDPGETCGFCSGAIEEVRSR